MRSARNATGEAGDTLVEVLIALVVIALTGAAILGAFATTISASAEHRNLAASDSVLRSFTETMTYDIQLSSVQPSNFVPCATNTSYNTLVGNTGFNSSPNGIAYKNGYTVAISAVTLLVNGTCTSATPELLTASVSSGPIVVDSMQFVVTKPDQSQATVNSAVYTISPVSAPATGGGTITVTAASGTPFAGATTVNFGPNSVPATVGGGGSSVTATIPAESNSQYLVFVSVTTPTGTTVPATDDLFTYGPTVTNVSPSTGPPVGGVSVTISGSGFTSTSTVKFGGTAATVTSFNGATSLTATAPAGAVGTVDITVTNPALTANGTSPISTPADQFTYGMSVTSVTPSTGPAAGGTTVTIVGSGFTGVTGVTFEGVAATGVTFVNDGQVTAVSPAGSGTVDVQVKTSAGQTSISAGDKFVYTGGAATPVGLGIYLSGASNPTPTLSCTWSGTGANSCTIKGVGCGGSTTFYVETVDGSGNPVVVSSNLGVLVSGASPSGVTIPAASFTTYDDAQSVTAQLPTGVSCKKKTQSETVTLAASINGNPVKNTITVSSS